MGTAESPSGGVHIHNFHRYYATCADSRAVCTFANVFPINQQSEAKWQKNARNVLRYTLCSLPRRGAFPAVSLFSVKETFLAKLAKQDSNIESQAEQEDFFIALGCNSLDIFSSQNQAQNLVLVTFRVLDIS